MAEKIPSFNLITVDEHRIATTINIYFDWKNLDTQLKTLSTRGMNLPSEISENVVCYCLGYQLNKGSSGDAFDPFNQKIIEIKGSSSTGPSSFSPSEIFDELVYMKVDKSSDTALIYQTGIDSVSLQSIPVNSHETVLDQQNKGRRPRFNIETTIINPLQINPSIQFNFRTKIRNIRGIRIPCKISSIKCHALW